MALQKFYALDKEFLHRDAGLAALTADAYVGTQIDQGGAVLTELITLVNVESIDISSGDETYEFLAVGSNVTDRSDAVVLGRMMLGKATAIPIETVDSTAGSRYTMCWQTAKDGTNYQYLDLYLNVTGTTPSIGFNAFTSEE